MTAHNPPSSNLRWLGERFELLLEISCYVQKLGRAADNAKSTSNTQISRPERSLASANGTDFKNDSTQPLAVFLHQMGLFLWTIVDSKDIEESGTSQVGRSSPRNGPNADKVQRISCPLLKKSYVISATWPTSHKHLNLTKVYFRHTCLLADSCAPVQEQIRRLTA